MHDRDVNFRRIEIINPMELQTVNIFELDIKPMHFNSMPGMNQMASILCT